LVAVVEEIGTRGGGGGILWKGVIGAFRQGIHITTEEFLLRKIGLGMMFSGFV